MPTVVIPSGASTPGAEAVVLDPSEVAIDRTELDISSWVAGEGIDWGDAIIEAYMAEAERGQVPVDFRVPNRTVAIPLVLKDEAGTQFVEIRSQIQAKAARFQNEGGWIKRVLSDGASFVYADVVSATLKLSGGWLQAHRDADIEAVLTLECLPDFYGDEVELDLITETTDPEIVAVLGEIAGDYPGRCRIVVNELDGDDQLGLLWGIRSRHYSADATAALAYQAEALTPLDTAAIQALTGASGSTIRHNNLATSWTPVLNTNLLAGTFLTHTGSYRMWARVYTTSTTPPQCRFVWDVGDLTFPVENPPKAIPAANNFYLVDLGEIRLDKATGTHRWQGQIQAKGAAGGENVYVDRLFFQPLDEGAGVLRAPIDAPQGLATYAVRDELNQASGALTGKTAPVGGVWTAVANSDTTDFQVGSGLLTRTATGDAGTIATAPNLVGRMVYLPTSLTATLAQVDLKATVGDPDLFQGLVVRWVNATNFVFAVLAQPPLTPNESELYLVKWVAGNATSLFGRGGTWPPSASDCIFVPRAVTAMTTVRLVVDAAGRWALWCYPQGSQGSVLAQGYDAALASGGALAAGNVGIYDANAVGTASTRTYDNPSAHAPIADAVLHASQSAELTTEGMFREDAAGAAYGPVSYVAGDLPRLPAAGMEDRPVELFLKGTRGDLDQLPDSGIDDISAQAIIRPCWLAPFS